PHVVEQLSQRYQPVTIRLSFAAEPLEEMEGEQAMPAPLILMGILGLADSEYLHELGGSHRGHRSVPDRTLPCLADRVVLYRHLGIAEGTDPDRDSDRVPPLVPTDPLRNLIDVDAARLRGFRLGGTRGGAPPSPRPRLQPRYERLPLTLLRLRGLQDLDRGAQVLVEPLR